MKQKTKRVLQKYLSLLLIAAILLTTQGVLAQAETVTPDDAEKQQAETVTPDNAARRQTRGRELPSNPVHHCTEKNGETDYTDWSYVYFGSYPQMEITGDALTAEITGAFYDENGDTWVDGLKYRRIKKSDANYSSTGNGYFQWGSDEEYHYFKWEQIKWRVLQNDGSTLFVVADKGLDCKDYNEEYRGYMSWEICTLRNWLNNDFYGTAFSSEEQGDIVQQTVVNEDNPYYDYGVGGNNTTDNIFLLSIGEVINPKYGFHKDKGFHNDLHSASRWVQATDYAHAMGAEIYSWANEKLTGNCCWWLRSPGADSFKAARISSSGCNENDGIRVDYYNQACVPALHINLSSELWSLADDGSSGNGGGSGTGSGVSQGGSLQCRSSCMVERGDSVQVTVQAYGDDAASLKKITESVTWNVQDSSVASVKSNGFTVSATPVSYKTDKGDYKVWGAVGSFTVTGKKAGTTVVTGKAWDGSAVACRVTVEEADNGIAGGSAGSEGVSLMLGQDASGSADDSVAQFFPNTWSLKCVAFPVERSREEDKDGSGSYTVKWSIGIARSDLLDDKAKWSQYKKTVDDINKYMDKYNDMEERMKVWGGKSAYAVEMNKFKKKPKLSIMGYLETKFDKNDNLISQEGKIACNMKWSGGNSWQFVTPIGPVYLNQEGGAKISGNITPVYDFKSKKVVPHGSLKFTPSISLEGGYGIDKVATIGAKGGLSAPITVVPASKGEVVAEASLHAKLLFVFDYERTLASYKKTIWNTTENSKSRSRAAQAKFSLSDGELSVMDTSFANDASGWNGGADGGTKARKSAGRAGDAAFRETALMDGILPSSLPMQAEINGRQVLVFQSYDSARDTLDSSVLMYSVCNGGVWSEPQPIWDNGCADLYADMKIVNGKLAVVWQKQKAKAVGDLETDSAAVLESMARNSEICFAQFDESSGTFVDQTYVTDNSEYDMMPKLCGGNGGITVAWVRNSAADLMQETGTNTIYTSAWNGDSFDAEAPLVQSFGTVDDFVAYHGQEGVEAIYAGIAADGEEAVRLIFDEGNQEIESLSSLLPSSASLSEMQYLDGKIIALSEGALYSYNPADGTVSSCFAGESAFGGTAKYCSNGEKSGFVWSVYDEETQNGRIVASMSSGDGYCEPVTVYEKEGALWRYISPVLKEDGNWTFVANAMHMEDGQEDYNSLVYIEKQQEECVDLAGVSVNEADTKDGQTGVDYYLKNTGDLPINQLQMDITFADGTVRTQEIAVSLMPGQSAADTVYVDLSDIDSAQDVSIAIYAKDQTNIEDCTVISTVGMADVEVSGTAEESYDTVDITADIVNDSKIDADTTLYLYSNENCEKELFAPQTRTITAGGSSQFQMQVKKEDITYNENGAAYLTLKAVVEGGDYNESNNISYVILYQQDAELQTVKQQAISELEAYKNASDYRVEQQSELADAIAEGKAAIESAADESGVDTALAAAKRKIDAIKTDAQLTEEENASSDEDCTHQNTEVRNYLDATCKAEGYSGDIYCKNCNTKIEDGQAIAATGKHTWDKGKENKAPSCTEKGEKRYTCSVCGETKKESLEKISHAYKTTVTKATTSKNGSITEKCASCGIVKSSETIPCVKSAALRTVSYTYNGKAKKPFVTVKDSSGKVVSAHNYTVKYKNNKKIGKASVTIKLQGNYTGTIKKTFKIVPKGTAISGKVMAQSKGFTVKWKKQKKSTTGYQIQVSTNKKFAKKVTVTKTVKKNSTTKLAIKRLKPKKRYYVRVRTYKTVKGKKYCSGWSKVKTVITKK